MKENQRLNFVECSGTPYEIGIQWGKGCKQNILISLEHCFGALRHITYADKENIISAALKYLPKVKEFDPYLIDIIQGQADGAGITFEEMFTLKCGFELMFHYNSLSTMCTSFAATGRATANGKTILGQNLDWFVGVPLDLLKIRHQDGLVQLAISIWGAELALSSAGYGICANGTWAPVPGGVPKIPFSCYLPKVMRQRTMSDAVELLRGVARGMEYYHLANDKREIFGIESIHNDFEVITPDNDIMAHSNHYLTERFKKGDMAAQIFPDSYKRIERIKVLINEQFGKITPQIMMNILSDHENFPYSICRHVDTSVPPHFHSATLASFIMIPEDRVIYVAAGNPCTFEYIEYKI